MRKKFYEDVVSIVAAGRHSLQANEEKIAELTAQHDDRRYSTEYRRELTRQIDSLRRIQHDTRDSAVDAVKHRCAVFKSELEGEYDLDANRITADVKLLDFPLSARDLASLALKNRTNTTMLQLILRHAESRGLDLGMRFVGNEDEIAQLPEVAHAAEVAMRHAGNDDVFNRLFGEGSAISRAFNVDAPPANSDPIALTDERVANAARLIREHPTMEMSSIERLVGEFKGQPAALTLLRDVAMDAINGRAMTAIDALLDA